MARKPGPKPQSADVVELHGNRSKLTQRQIEERRQSEVKPRPIRPKAPAGLSLYARECWDHHAHELETLGLLTVLDGGSFRLLCECFAIALEALDALKPTKGDGTPDRRTKRLAVMTIDERGLPRRHPALIVFFQAAKEYRALCGDFGLTPSSRVGLRPAGTVPGASTGGDEGSVDDDADFFGT